jgi:transcriptional regulator with XRE-family HTH domain
VFITIQQIKAARALLDWTQEDLAGHSGLNIDQIRRFEAARSRPLDVLESIYNTLIAQGLDFVDGGVKRKALIKEYSGAEGFRAFMDDVYNTVKENGGIVCAHNVHPDYWMKWLGKEFFLLHTGRMQKIEKDYEVRITIKQDDHNLLGSKHAEYRWLPERLWNDQSFYSYGDKLALMTFQPDDVNIRVIHNLHFAEGFRSLFNLAWDNIPPIPNVERKQ